jgi:serine/threonine-protein kinase RsbW
MTAQRRAFPARTDALPRVEAFVERRCRLLGADRNATLRLMLAAEELFINAVTHGYGGRGRGRVTLAINDCGSEVELVAEDTAVAFDVFANVPEPPAARDPRDAPIGGLGRALVAGMASRHAYERRAGRNRVTVAVGKGPLQRARPHARKNKRKK